MHITKKARPSILAMAVVLIPLGSVAAAQPEQPGQPAPVDLVFVNGNVMTVDREFSVAQAVAVSDGRFMRVGRNEEVRALAGQKTRIVDLKGQTVVPGFIDTHPHTFGRGGRGLRSPSLAGLGSVRAITEAVAREVRTTPPGQWIVTTPIGEPPDSFHLPESLEEKRWPTRTDLDVVAPANPVYIPIGIWPYPVIFNGEALKALGITANEPPDAQGVRIERDPSSGEPTGLVRGMTFYNRSPLWGKLQGMLPRPVAKDAARRSPQSSARQRPFWSHHVLRVARGPARSPRTLPGASGERRVADSRGDVVQREQPALPR